MPGKSGRGRRTGGNEKVDGNWNGSSSRNDGCGRTPEGVTEGSTRTGRPVQDKGNDTSDTTRTRRGRVS